jgi:DNA-binding IscR family transcriptional regulator
MTAFSKRVEYGLMALFHLDESSDDELTSRRQISDAYQIPLELAGKVLQDLNAQGW